MSTEDFIRNFKEETGFYHERQEQLRCGQHTLNNLLQKKHFSDEQLSTIAKKLDNLENSVHVFRKEQPMNMEASGYCNIQVLQLALEECQLELVPLESQHDEAKKARENLEYSCAYVCNVGEHWFAVRRFGPIYFDLNSMYIIPMMIYPQKLKAYLDKYKSIGLSLFLVHGTIPKCLAEEKFEGDPNSLIEYCLTTWDMATEFQMKEMEMHHDKISKLKNVFISLPRHMREQLLRNPNSLESQQIVRQHLPAEFQKGQLYIAISDKRNDHTKVSKKIAQNVITQRKIIQKGDHVYLETQTIALDDDAGIDGFSDDFNPDFDDRFPEDFGSFLMPRPIMGGRKTEDMMMQTAIERSLLDHENKFKVQEIPQIEVNRQDQEIPRAEEKIMQGFIRKQSTQATTEEKPSLNAPNSEKKIVENSVVPQISHVEKEQKQTLINENLNDTRSSLDNACENVADFHDMILQLRTERKRRFGNRDVSIIQPFNLDMDD